MEREKNKDFRVGLRLRRSGEINPIRCEAWNRNCEKVRPSSCKNCRWGWYEVVGGKCRKNTTISSVVKIIVE